MCMFFFFNDTATTEIYTLSLHDALPILALRPDLRLRTLTQSDKNFLRERRVDDTSLQFMSRHVVQDLDRKSTRLNSSHANISYAVFCLKKKKHYTIYSRTSDHICSTKTS